MGSDGKLCFSHYYKDAKPRKDEGTSGRPRAESEGCDSQHHNHKGKHLGTMRRQH